MTMSGVDFVDRLGALANFGFVVFPKAVQIGRNRRDVVLAQELNQISFNSLTPTFIGPLCASAISSSVPPSMPIRT